MLRLEDYYNAIDDFAPFKLAESWDNVGIIIGDNHASATKVMLALDITQKVVAEAVENKVDLIITHHPLMFSPVKRLPSNSMEYLLIKNGISLLTAHTNLDATKGGINDLLAELIGLKNIRPLGSGYKTKHYNITVYIPNDSVEEVYNALAQNGVSVIENYSGCGFLAKGEGRFTPLKGAKPTVGSINKLEKVRETALHLPAIREEQVADVISIIKKSHPYEIPAFSVNENLGVSETATLGRVGELEAPVSPKEFASKIKKNLNAPGVRYTSLNKEIKTVGICSGGGSGLINDIIAIGVDAFVTGELKHNVVLEASNNFIDSFQAGHFVTETIIMPRLKTELEKRIEKADIIISTQVTDEIRFI